MSRRALSRGLSLIEVLVALSILSVSLLALIPLFSLGMRSNASSNQLGMANTLAGEKLEELIGYPSTDPRLAITIGQSSVQGGDPSGAGYKAQLANDLPLWYNPSNSDPSNGTIAFTTAIPAANTGWYPFPCTRTYSVASFKATDTTHLVAATSTLSDESAYNTNDSSGPQPYYSLKLVTVTVQPVGNTPFPGLRRTVQSAYVRYRNAATN